MPEKNAWNRASPQRCLDHMLAVASIGEAGGVAGL
jgi:hypothetical protein